MYTGAQSVSNMLMTTSAAGIYSTTPYANSTYFTIAPDVVVDGVTDYGNKFSYNAATSVTMEAAASTLVQSPVTAVCVSCHDSAIARNHMKGNGGVFYTTRSTALAINQSEQCLMCHGPGRIASIKDVHSR
jgi:OmcA/MtrC family decaheme c-type cytochrome